MKICAIICEYNPFHNGHLYQLALARERSNADAILCIMSGNFVQRGEGAIMDKYTRAKHAILAGADAVIELPTLFATSNAELFAKGAIHLLKSIPEVSTLCFGAENADADCFMRAAALLNNEPHDVSQKIKEFTAQGMSYAKARAEAWRAYIPEEFLTAPNNVLGLEYTKAILATNANIQILPIRRIGGNYKDETLQKNYSSASAIRNAIQSKHSFADNLPSFIQEDIPASLENQLEILEKYAILANSTESIKQVCDCTEGLENAFKRAAEQSASFVESLTSARYTSSRIRRIALQNLLQINEKLIRDSLSCDLYLRILAIKKENGSLLSVLGKAKFPLLIRGKDENKLSDNAKTCLAVDYFAEKIYTLLYPNTKDKEHIFL